MSVTYLFSEAECKQIAGSLIGMKNVWQHRYGDIFFSVGALSYADTEGHYIDNIKKYNAILENNFMWAYNKIREYYQKNIEKPIRYWTQEPNPKALPGFHIFQNAKILNQNKWSAPIHTDNPEQRHAWHSEIVDIFTFTISIKSPRAESGLRFWMDTEKLDNMPTLFDECSIEEQNTLKEEAVYIPYRIGYIYEHTGDLYHQIATEGNFNEGEMRITLQGHLAESEDFIVIYV